MRSRSALVLLVMAALTLTCGGTRPCRNGTVFLTLRLGAFTTADHVAVTVTLEGGSSRQQQLALAGASIATVEITFPSGYPVGKRVQITAALTKNGSTLASKDGTIVLGPGCAALEIAFLPVSDGGSDGTPGTGGASTGGQGQGGLSGSGGSATGGTNPASGGTGAGTGGIAGTGGMVGTGGIAGTGGTGTGGGSGGRAAGTGGTATSTGGAATSSGGADAGTADRGCMATGVESCFDGLDNDCNGLIDCADLACAPTAQCEPLDPALGAIGTSVQASAECPTAAPNARALMTGLSATGCTGCSCAAGTATMACSAEIFGYHNINSPGCAANVGGSAAGTLDSTQGCFKPNWADPSVYGLRSGPFQGRPVGTCLPSGSASKGTPVWTTTTKFCGVRTVGGGCAPGSVCVPRAVVATGACLLLDGAHTCPAAVPRQSSWFTGFTDSRTCGPCTCGNPTGGNCGSMIIAVGSEGTCAGSAIRGYVRDGDRICLAPNVDTAPSLQFSGTPVLPTCAASVVTSGALSSTGAQTLCCM